MISFRWLLSKLDDLQKMISLLLDKYGYKYKKMGLELLFSTGSS